MSKEETLNYLMARRHLTARVAVEKDKVHMNKAEAEKAIRKWWGRILISVIFTWSSCSLMRDGNMGLYNGNQLGGLGGFLLFGGITVFLLFRKYKQWSNAENAIAEAEEIIRQEKSKPEYQNGLKGFPEKFCNYSDIYRLWNLVNEGRAETLKEAYNLLETQHFQEDQISIQEKIRSLHQDMAASARVAAVASTVSAYNTTKVARKISKVIK